MTQRDLLISDIHLEDTKEAEYRWEIFSWLHDVIDKYKIDRLIVAGDITEKKNNHSSKLVNRIVNEFSRLHVLIGEDDPIIVLVGNHDYDKSSDDPFFRFLDREEGDRVRYIEKAWQGKIGKEYFLPHTKTPEKDWKDLDFEDIERVFMHQCVNGAKFANNYEVEKGVNIDDLIPKYIKIYSGDIHSPQEIGDRFTYIGSPYSIDYGDSFDGRVMILEDGKEDISLYPNFLKKWSIKIKEINDLENYDLKEGDRIKIKIQLLPSQYCDWQNKRKEVIEYLEDKGIEIKGISMEPIKVQKRLRIMPKASEYYKKKDRTIEDWIRHFWGQEELSEEYLKIGMSLLED